MIHIVIGTKAQLIKMAPVMVELQRRVPRHEVGRVSGSFDLRI